MSKNLYKYTKKLINKLIIMKVKIEFNTDNAAFEDFENEVCNVLDDIKNRIDYLTERNGLVLRDTNGNIIGSVELKK